jgi:glycosyltransferase involved in cell wall biosynthesis
MRIAIDARTVYHPSRRGTGKNLIDLYRGIAKVRPQWHFLMFHQGYGRDNPFADLPNVEPRHIDIKGDRLDLWLQVRLPLAARMARAQVLHCPDQMGPRHPLVPMVVTIHDVVPLEMTPESPRSKAWGRGVAASARKARHIITPSEYSKRQIIERFGICPSKITVNYWAADKRYQKVTDGEQLQRVRIKYGLGSERPYVFAFGAAEPRKNTSRILQAWARLPASLRAEYGLLVVGIQEPARTAFRKQADDLGLQEGCFLHGFADEDDIPALLSGATALCYPSLSEGFGLPVVDAFACDTPVLTSSTTSLPEVAGDAALLIDPQEIEAIRGGLQRLLSERSLRTELIIRARERLKQFTWENCIDSAARILADVGQQ